MAKNLLKESILPAFWLFFFIASSKGEKQIKEIRKADNIELKKQNMSTAGGENSIDKNKQAGFTKAMYLSGF